MEEREPPFMKRRWVRCTHCLRTYAFTPPYKGKLSRCCAAPVRSKLWGGWSLREPPVRVNLARAEDQRARLAQEHRSQGGAPV